MDSGLRKQLDVLKARKNSLDRESDKRFDNIDKLISESNRIADVAANARMTLDELTNEFYKRTGFTKLDYSFLMLATSLQVARYWISEQFINRDRLSDKAGADKVKHNPATDKLKDLFNEEPDKSGNEAKRIAELNYGLWVIGPTTYDAFARIDKGMDLGIGGRNHRYTTLAHDPLMGLIFGPMNLLTMTITRSDFTTFKTIPNDSMNPATGYKVGAPILRPEAFIGTSTVGAEALAVGVQNPKFLAAATVKHLIHLASDVDTVMGLPIPGAGAILPDEVNKWLLDNGMDSTWFANIGTQYAVSQFINTIISTLHYWISVKVGNETDERLISVKNKKMIMYSNQLAMELNSVKSVVELIGQDYAGAIKDFDFGGLLSFIKTINESEKVERHVKEEFVFGSFEEKIDMNFSLED